MITARRPNPGALFETKCGICHAEILMVYCVGDRWHMCDITRPPHRIVTEDGKIAEGRVIHTCSQTQHPTDDES